MIYNIFEWFCDFAATCQDAVKWFFSSTNILGYDIKPIYLVCGSLLVVGIIRGVTHL